ncbi:MAG: hypothetical protein EON61_08870 [Alphaproteobacteria bacterium]|nr:MAG: hypothetical protein EON61_08870 [Alphaproteobacteria bacterium]
MPALSSYLRKVLLADTVVSGAAGLVMIGGADLTHDLLGLPSTLLFWAGAALIPFATLLAMIARVGRAPVWLIAAIIVTNFAWVAGSLFLAFGPAFGPSLFGQVFVIAQAAIVAVFAESQIIGLRRLSAAA